MAEGEAGRHSAGSMTHNTTSASAMTHMVDGDRADGTLRATRPTPGGDASTGELIGRASEQLTDLVRSEMQLARVELQETVKRAGIGAGLFGTAGVVALYGLGVLIAAAVLALALVLDAWLAALIVAVVLFAAAGVAALVGRKQVAQVTPPIHQSVESIKQDVQTVKDRDTA